MEMEKTVFSGLCIERSGCSQSVNAIATPGASEWRETSSFLE